MAINQTKSPGLQTATVPELIALLLRHELAEPLLLALKERELVAPSSAGASKASPGPQGPAVLPIQAVSAGMEPSGIEPSGMEPSPWPTPGQPSDPGAAIAAYRRHHHLDSDAALEQWCFRHALQPAALLEEALNLQGRQALPLDGAPGSEESLFLRFKDQLDRVLYGLIRVDQQALAQDLFFAIEAGELRFGEAARRYSVGPEARTEGIVGPVDLATPHPEISSRLKIAAPGELILPFKLDQWHIILRLDYRFEASLDQATRQFLRDLSLRSQARAAIEPELVALAAWVQGAQSAAPQ